MPVEGNLIRRSWFLAYDNLPASPSRTRIVQSWDVAMMTGGQNDYSACTTWLTHKNDAYLLHVYWGRLEYLAEIVPRMAHLIGIVQRGADQALVIRLKRHHPLALGQHHAPQRHQGFAAHRLADHRKGVLPDRIVGGNVIGRIEEALVDLRTLHKAIDVDYVRARDLDRLQLLIFDEEILAFADLVAAGFLMSLDDFAGFLVNELLAQPVAGLAIDLAERNPLRR